MKVGRNETEYLCVNESETDGMVKIQGEEIVNLDEFKYLGSVVRNN